ncbi:MAG TPA: OsmC family peroxiredoxin [Solirubrobacterales bacterium]|nr:OsmC family peroxiredoxin [Solirubrobacterales bacterium]
MAKRSATAVWNGGLTEGDGTMEFGSGAFSGQYSFKSRFEEGDGTNPEELIAAAQAGCYSMQLAAGLEKGGHTADSVETTADVHLTPKEGGGFEISRIDLHTRATVTGIDADELSRLADEAKQACLVSAALAGVREITVDATLETS